MSNVVCRWIVVLVGILCFSNVTVFAESLEECLARWDRVLKNFIDENIFLLLTLYCIGVLF